LVEKLPNGDGDAIDMEERLLQHEITLLVDEFRGTFSPEIVERCVRDSMERLKEARVRQYLTIFAYRFARERLTALAGVEGRIHSEARRVLFICVRNAGRSQMAAAFARQLSTGSLEVYSAGSQPAGEVNPAVIEVMREIGLDLSSEFPEPLTDEIVQAADVVITMGCGDECRLYPYKKYEDWPIEDPEGQPLEKVRDIRDAIRARVEGLLIALSNVP
jgi:arsenate reductase